jgi:hypothetical protein
VQQKPLFADIIAQHPGLAEELKAQSEGFDLGFKAGLAVAQPAVPHGWKLVREWAEKWAAISYEDSWKYAAREVLTMLATTPVQPALVSLTDEQERKVAKLFNDRVAAMCHVDAADHWKHYSDEILDEVRFVLNAAHGIAAAPEKGGAA